MEARIDESGWISIERGGQWKRQFCPWQPVWNRCYCGDWCPQFSEPDSNEDTGGHSPHIILHCGDGSVRHDLVEDLRNKEPLK